MLYIQHALSGSRIALFARSAIYLFNVFLVIHKTLAEFAGPSQQMCSQLMQKFIVTFGTGGNSCCTLCATLLATLVEPPTHLSRFPRIPNPTPMAAKLTVKLPHSRGCRKEKHEKPQHTHTHTHVCVSPVLCFICCAARGAFAQFVQQRQQQQQQRQQFSFYFYFHFILLMWKM